MGDLVLRLLAQEDRYPPIRQVADTGRAGHRRWVGEVFSPWLAGLSTAEAEARLDALVVATDVYVWKLVRRDMGRSASAFEALCHRLIAAALTTTPLQISRPETEHDS